MRVLLNATLRMSGVLLAELRTQSHELTYVVQILEY